MSDLENKVDSLITDFDAWFQQRGNEGIVRSERAILKTFCWYLTQESERALVHGMEVKLEVDKKRTQGGDPEGSPP